MLELSDFTLVKVYPMLYFDNHIVCTIDHVFSYCIKEYIQNTVSFIFWKFTLTYEHFITSHMIHNHTQSLNTDFLLNTRINEP